MVIIMATVTYIREKTQNKTAMGRVMCYVCQDKKTLLDEIKLVSGVNCCGEVAFDEFMATRQQYGKAHGTFFYQYVQSFHPDENISPQKINEIGCKLAEYFKGHEVLVCTHIDADHKHNHLIINSVNMETGKKLQLKPGSINDIRSFSDDICREYGLKIVEPAKTKAQSLNTREYRSAVKGESWKFALMNAIDSAMAKSTAKADFIANMENLGYKVNWQDTHKYITYTTPTGLKCRDKQLHDEKYMKSKMEEYYAGLEQIKGAEQAGKSARGIQYEVKSVCDTAAVFGGLAENAYGNCDGTNSNAGAGKKAADMGGHYGKSESDVDKYGSYANRGGGKSGIHSEKSDGRFIEEFDNDNSDDNYGEDDLSGEYAQTQGYEPNPTKSKVGRDWCDDALDILYLAKTIESMVNPYDPSEKKNKKKPTKSRKRDKKCSHIEEHEQEM